MNSNKTLGRLILRNAIFRRNYGRKHNTATMNDLPVPQGDFFARHAANQRKYNMILGVGIAAFATSIYSGFFTGAINCNWGPPDSYE